MTDESAFASNEAEESVVKGSLRGDSKGLSGLSSFVETKQYRLFTEFCETCQVYRYIGVCYGEAGVGKTRSARRLTRWDQMERRLVGDAEKQAPGAHEDGQGSMAFYTPEPSMSAKRLEQEILRLHVQMKMLSSLTSPLMREQGALRWGYPMTPLEWELLVIDEADRLKPMGLEVLRDFYDRSQMGMIFIGMPGIEKRLARYPQLYSRV